MILLNRATIDTLVGKGLNAFRKYHCILKTSGANNYTGVPVMMERIIPTSMTGVVNSTYTTPMTTYVNYITSKGAYAILDPHNFARYYGKVIDDYAGFKAFWQTTAAIFKSNDKVVFDCNNEPHDMGSASTAKLMQACIDGVRAAGATTQYIFVEGTSYTGAWTW
jgi:endoglucanase